jgi:hypothetical protein
MVPSENGKGDRDEAGQVILVNPACIGSKTDNLPSPRYSGARGWG